MRILHVYLTDIRKTWANIIQTLQMCEALSKLHEVNFFHPFILRKSLNERLGYFNIKGDFKITRVFASGPLKNKYLDFLNRIIFFLQILFYSYFSEYDLIYTRDFSFLVFLSKIPNFLRPRGKILYEVHRVYSHSSNKINNQVMEVECLRIPDFIMAVSNGIKHDLVQLGIDKNKIEVVPNGVKVDKFFVDFDQNSFRRSNSISQSEVVIIYAGSWGKSRGVDVLIKAYSEVLKKVDNCKLILVGGSKAGLIKRRQLVKSLNINEKRILLFSFMSQTEVAKFLKISDIGVIPNIKTTEGSRYTSPLKLFEYMASGLAIIASNLPSIREILTDKEAIFFEPENERDLAGKLIDLINDKMKRERMRFLMSQRVKDFSYEERHKKITRLIGSGI